MCGFASIKKKDEIVSGKIDGNQNFVGDKKAFKLKLPFYSLSSSNFPVCKLCFFNGGNVGFIDLIGRSEFTLMEKSYFATIIFVANLWITKCQDLC